MFYKIPISNYTTANKRLLEGYDIVIGTNNPNLSFRKQVLEYLQQGYQGKKIPFKLVLGEIFSNETHSCCFQVIGLRGNMENEDLLHLLKQI